MTASNVRPIGYSVLQGTHAVGHVAICVGATRITPATRNSMRQWTAARGTVSPSVCVSVVVSVLSVVVEQSCSNQSITPGNQSITLIIITPNKQSITTTKPPSFGLRRRFGPGRHAGRPRNPQQRLLALIAPVTAARSRCKPCCGRRTSRARQRNSTCIAVWIRTSIAVWIEQVTSLTMRGDACPCCGSAQCGPAAGGRRVRPRAARACPAPDARPTPAVQPNYYVLVNSVSTKYTVETRYGDQ